MAEQGPVRIIDAKGLHPSALDRAIEEQRKYYAAGDLNGNIAQSHDHTKRGFSPK